MLYAFIMYTITLGTYVLILGSQMIIVQESSKKRGATLTMADDSHILLVTAHVDYCRGTLREVFFISIAVELVQVYGPTRLTTELRHINNLHIIWKIKS